MRPKVMITNSDKTGNVSSKWYVRIGKRWRLFSQSDWEKDGMTWINEQLGG